jgi:hypothetical protein
MAEKRRAEASTPDTALERQPEEALTHSQSAIYQSS